MIVLFFCKNILNKNYTQLYILINQIFIHVCLFNFRCLIVISVFVFKVVFVVMV